MTYSLSVHNPEGLVGEGIQPSGGEAIHIEDFSKNMDSGVNQKIEKYFNQK